MTQQQSYIGQQLGHYRLVHLLGSGGFADVYVGEHVHLHTQAAVKILHTRLTHTDIEEFRREAQTVAFLQHPSIVRVLDFGVEDTIPYLAMDYAPNGSMRNRYPKGTLVPVSEVTPILMQIASALQYAHDHRLIHRDIKPENMLLGRNFEALLGDFGIALVTQNSQSQSAQNIAGTIAYMAPEQIQAHPRPASDQYALGIVVYEWLSGQRPFQGSYTEIAIKHSLTPPPPLRERIPHLPLAIEQVVMKALQKDPQQRFENVMTFAQTFTQVAQSATQSQQFSPFTPAPLPASSSRPAQFMYTTLTPPDAPLSTSNPDLQPSSFTPPSQSSAPPAMSNTPPALWPSSTVNPPYAITPIPNTNLYPEPSPTPSYSTYVPPAHYQPADPAFQPAQPQPAYKPSTISRRSFIGGGIAGLVVAGGVGVWLYTHHATGGQPPGLSMPTGSRPIPSVGATADKPLLTYAGHHDLVQTISWSPDGTSIASGSRDGQCHVWTADKGKLTFSVHSTIQPPISDDSIQSIVWSRHNPPRIAVGFVDGTLQILDIDQRQRITSLDQGYATYGILSWSPDEKYLAVCKDITENAVAIYEIATWKIVYTYLDHTDSVHAVAWSPDGKYLASGSNDTTIRIWEPFNGKTHLMYKEHTGAIVAIDWSSDSTKIVSTAQDYVVRIWQPDTGKTLYTYQYPSRAPMGKVVWSHNNHRVATYPGSATVDILDEQLMVKQTIHSGVVFDISWSPDDTRIVTANYDNVAQIWQVRS